LSSSAVSKGLARELPVAEFARIQFFGQAGLCKLNSGEFSYTKDFLMRLVKHPWIWACFFLAGPLTLASFAGENWPGWRGPTGMGQSDENNLPLTWGGKDLENVLWKVPLFSSEKVKRDQNQSSPIVWGERVIVTTSYWPEGVSQKEYPEHHVSSFSAKTGAKQWDIVIEPGPWKLTDLRGGYTCSTPACDAERIYVLFGSSVLAAVDHTGKLLWRKEIAPFTFDVAIGTSPVLYENTVLVTCDLAAKASKLLAFDRKTGDLVWQQQRKVDWTHSTPVLADFGGKKQLLMASAFGPQGLDPATGQVLWEFKTKERVGDTLSPVVKGNLVYVDSGRGGGPGIAVDATGSGDVSATNLRWRITGVPEGFSSPLVIGDFLYRLLRPGVLSCRQWSDGKEVYKERLQGLDPDISPAISPFATPDGRIYCVSAGKSQVIQAGAKFESLAQNDLGDASRASPAVADGRIPLKGSRFLFCVGKK
jgi:outer membrane protein assembly factor BamB